MKRLQVILNMRRISYCYCAFLVLLAGKNLRLLSFVMYTL